MLGELMHRIGQPPIMGQLLAGVLLGPSCLGALLPSLSHALLPPDVAQKAMLDAFSQLGILLLLLLTGMETDLSVFRDARRTAISISIFGIVIPFGCGVLLGELLPETLLPNPTKRLITTLFLGTALSISSVKIVALVVRDLGFLRRRVGQVIVASAVIDDTIGWIIMSVIFGLAIHGRADFATISRAIAGTAVFLVLSFTIGRRLIFRLIRWANDSLRSELALISMILAITLSMALLTEAIGVHTVLGAFIAGVLVGQSPMVTRRLGEQLRGLIVALFMPIFFGLAGLSTDLTVLVKPNLLLLTVGMVLLASIGKFTGAFIGGRIGGLSYRESLAVGSGMNARGSTEVIVASIGLSMGALNQTLFTAIVAMAVVTTTAMPPMLKWALQCLPMDAQERARLEREEFEAQGFLKHIERILVAVDDSPNGRLASQLVGLLAGVRRIPTTVLDFAASSSEDKAAIERATATIKAEALTGDEAASATADRVDITTRTEKANTLEEAIVAEARKGYGLLVIGRQPSVSGNSFDSRITRTALSFDGPFAIAIDRTRHGDVAGHTGRLNVLAPITGTAVSRDGAEVAIALAQASEGSIAALYITNAGRMSRNWRQQFAADAAIKEIVAIGEHYGIEVRGLIRRGHPTENAILKEISSSRYNLLVMGVSPRPGAQLFLGDVAADVLERAHCPLLLVSGEHR
jgi:Kef-type K+ transport system membrane component KefB/nucleotide-binding universal stress UspA family protein